ncbi:MAG: Uma2 family endonuclease [Hormoscilla sp. GM102CHS1]|nr:Uma2 family endonuclease [Hormoscilla sp. GM102CHS1]
MTQAVVSATEVAIKEPPEIEHLLTFQEYLDYEVQPGVLYELVKGKLIPMGATTHNHTNIYRFLVLKFQRYFATKKLDLVVTGLATGVRTEEKTSRIPDVVVYSKAVWNKVRHRPEAGVLDFDEKPMLIIKIVSSDRRNDYVIKRNEYEVAEIAEYWIVDPKEKRVRVFANPSNEEGYRFVDFTAETSIVSSQFEEFSLSVKELLDSPSVEDLILAEQAEMETWKQQAETERQRAEAERQRAETERQRAETERQQAQAERQRTEKLAQRLLKMGVPPDEIDKIISED